MCSQSGVHRLVIVEVVVAVVVVFPKWRKGHLRRKMKQKSKSVWAQKWASGQWKCCLPACWCHCSLGNNNSADSCSSGRRRQRNQNVLPCQSSYHRSFVCKSPSISSSSNQKLVVDARLIDNIDAMRQRHMGKPGQRLRQRQRRWCVCERLYAFFPSWSTAYVCVSVCGEEPIEKASIRKRSREPRQTELFKRMHSLWLFPPPLCLSHQRWTKKRESQKMLAMQCSEQSQRSERHSEWRWWPTLEGKKQKTV